MLYKTKGIVLHTVKYSESSIIAKIYTEDLGLLSFLVHGVRKSHSKTSINLFQHLSLVEIDFNFKQGANIQHIKEIKCNYHFTSIPFDIIKSSVALFINEIIYRSIHEEEPNQELFEFLHNSIKILDLSCEKTSYFHLLFAIQFTKYLGFYPINNYSENNRFFNLRDGTFQNFIPDVNYSLNAEESFCFSKLLDHKFDDPENLIIPYSIKISLIENIIDFYKIHLNFFKEIKSHQILSEILK
jgi:DNA repair protein RecO (recombination protein O)